MRTSDWGKFLAFGLIDNLIYEDNSTHFEVICGPLRQAHTRALSRVETRRRVKIRRKEINWHSCDEIFSPDTRRPGFSYVADAARVGLSWCARESD